MTGTHIGRALGSALLLASLAAGRVSAHQYWLAPSRYVAVPQQPVEVSAFAGTGFRGEPKPWSPGRCVRFVARTVRSIDLSRAAAPGETTWARFAPVDGGGTLLAYESGFALIELAPDAFDAYLADEGLDGPLATRRGAGSHIPGRERYRRCAKSWLAGSDLARASAVLGLPLEIVPLGLPGGTASLRVRVLLHGKPLPGARVKTWRSPLAEGAVPLDAAVRDSVAMAWQSVTNARGELAVPCRAAGEWLVSVVHMQPCRETSVADWESTWASLTFARLPETRAGR